jgi:hypothetical protein
MSSGDRDNIKNYTDPAARLVVHGLGQDDKLETSDEQAAKAAQDRENAAKAASMTAAQRAAAGLSPSGEQFSTRRQSYDDLAGAASVSRTGSDSDLLGFMGSRKRAGAARRILGS